MRINKNKVYPLGECSNPTKFFINTKIKRKPLKREYYLSGSTIEAYLAFNDLSTAYYIAREVKIIKSNEIEVELL